MAEFFTTAFNEIVNHHIYQPVWWVSQFFAFLSLIVMFWSFQIKDKLKMMLLLGLGTTFLAVSAAFLSNWTLTVLFMLASIRNYVFCYLEWRVLKNRAVARWVWYFFGAVFITATVASTVILVHVIQVDVSGVWVEWAICLTLIGLIVGNVITGTDLMRVSFVANRAFNIINHAYFGNAIAVIIACLTISSNIIYYVRQLVAWRKAKKSTKIEGAAVAHEGDK
ncbi:MAG: YgjV family protein [Defluviitaleaceae bacterium]|nr:YgjV family protein [Defluviitaleaceae bacterium]